MKVRLINYTQDALETLLFTKNTRLNMAEMTLDDIKAWPNDKKMAELRYMMGTIKSSWEFVDYIFQIDDVTRAFTHQLVRHRAGTAFAQQTQRVVDMSQFTYETTGTAKEQQLIYSHVMEQIRSGYECLKAAGVETQDARGVLPTNIHTSITFKTNLRTLHQMAKERLCIRAQGEFQHVMKAMRDEIIKVHPWASSMLRVHCAIEGTCCFPNHVGCPIKPNVYDPRTTKAYDGGQPISLDEIQLMWSELDMEIQPNGK